MPTVIIEALRRVLIMFKNVINKISLVLTA